MHGRNVQRQARHQIPIVDRWREAITAGGTLPSIKTASVLQQPKKIATTPHSLEAVLIARCMAIGGLHHSKFARCPSTLGVSNAANRRKVCKSAEPRSTFAKNSARAPRVRSPSARGRPRLRPSVVLRWHDHRGAHLTGVSDIHIPSIWMCYGWVMDGNDHGRQCPRTPT